MNGPTTPAPALENAFVKRNPVDHPVHEPFEMRWSPYAFDPARSVETATLNSLFEAARWAMSSLEPLTALVIGYAGANPELDGKLAERDGRERTREPLSEIILQGAL